MKTMLRRLFPVLALSLPSFLYAATPNGFPVDPAVSTNLAGNTITLALMIPQGQQPFGFQWSTGGGDLEGQRFPTLTLHNLQLTDTGIYMVTYTNLVGDDYVEFRSAATVYVVDTPVVYEPIARSSTGNGITFIADAIGGLLSYQWTWQGYDIPGATSNALSFSDIYAQASAGYYAVRVSNPAGEVTSADTVLLSKPTPTGTYQGLFFDDSEASLESTGSFRYTVSSTRRSFSGLITLGTRRYRFAGNFDEAHTAESASVLLSGEQVRAFMQLITTNDTPKVAGWVSGAGWTSPLRGDRLYYSSKVPTSLAGKYTLALLNANAAPGSPNGHGYAAVVVRKSGSLTLSGHAADGTRISHTAGLSRLGEWPMHVSMNREQARLVGWLRLQKQTGGSIRGTNLFWVKNPVETDKLYPGGFKLALQPLGSTFAPLTNTTTPILTSSNWTAAVYGGDMFDGDLAMWIVTRIWLRPPSELVAEPSYEKFKLSVSRKNGVVQGAFTDPATGRRASIRGVVLQQLNSARGFFTSTNSAGAFALAPAAPPQ